MAGIDTTGLLSQIQHYITGGFATNWQSFGTSSKWDPNEKGQDIGLPSGTAILGMNGATVTAVDPTWAGASGGLVQITDALGNIFRVGHITPNVTVGQTIDANTIIGYSAGAAGAFSSGPHIEFQVQPNGAGSTIDPVGWLKDVFSGSNIPQPPAFPPGTTTPVTFQPSPGSPVTVTGPTVPTGSGVSGTCSKPTAFNIGFPGGSASNIADWLGYFGCVSSYWLARVGLALAAGALVIVGIWIYSQDKDAPGAQGLQALARRAPAVPGPAFAERTAAKEVRASSSPPQGKHVSLDTMEKRAKAHSDANALGVRLNSAAVNRHAGSIW